MSEIYDEMNVKASITGTFLTFYQSKQPFGFFPQLFGGRFSQGFTHFKRVAGIVDDKCFKDLRTTFISKTHMKYGDINLTGTVSDHSTEEVLRKHYLAQIEAAKRMADFTLFGED